MLSKDKDFKRKTGLIIDPAKWNNKKGMPKHPGETYVKLSNIADNVWRALENTSEPDGDWLESVMHGSGIMLSDIIKEYIKQAPKMRNSKNGVGLSHNRIKNLGTFENLISKYKDVQISEVGKNYVNGLVKWMGSYSNNYIVKTYENLKGVVRYAKRNGHMIDESIFNVQLYWEKKQPVTLTLEELEYIKTLELGERLSNVRKWLLFGCYTGQRVGDLFSIKQTDIKTVRGQKIIELQQEKTFKRVVIPLIPDALEVLKDGFPKVISVQKFNSYLKELMKVAGIDKKITSHCLRRSFATNYYGKIPTPLIMSVTGHQKESSLLLYIGKSDYDMAFEFLNYFKK